MMWMLVHPTHLVLLCAPPSNEILSGSLSLVEIILFCVLFFLLTFTFTLSFSFYSIFFSLVIQIFGWWVGEISVYLRELVSLMQPLLRLTQTNSDWLFLDEWKVNSHILEIISKETQTQINLIFQ